MENCLKEGLIVSCQALKEEPLYGGNTMLKMARAAILGGAVGIRANSVHDIKMIKKGVNVPVIGLIKCVYPDSEVYITPTIKEVKSLLKTSCDVIALDATNRFRHNGEKLEDLVRFIRQNSNKEIMADISTLEDGLRAEEMGFDYLSSTLCGYTSETKHIKIPDIEFLKELKNKITKSKVIAEGGIGDHIAMNDVVKLGYKTIIIGTAITRPREITASYVDIFNHFANV